MKVEVIISTSQGDSQITENASKVKVTVGESEFRISVNNRGELVVNKNCFGAGSSSILIEPRVSNEIILK